VITRRFWALQLSFWPGYGLVLMLPWLGTYSIGSMLGNKLAVAGTGVLAGSALRPVLEYIRRKGRGLPAAALFVGGVVLAGGLWDLSLTLLLRRSVDLDFRQLGAIVAGVPQLGGVMYHALIVAVWSLAWLLLSGAGPVSAPPDRIVLRDGRKSIVLGPREIEWVEAEGDYVRVRTATRKLLIRATLGGTEAKLPAPDYLRIHRSAIVRVDQVREVHPRPNNELEVVLGDGTRLRASRTYSERLKAALGRPGTLTKAD